MRHPLDAELVEESYEEIRREKLQLEVMLAGKHELPLFGFARELNSRLRSGELTEDMEMMQWQSLNAALLDWLEAPEMETEPRWRPEQPAHEHSGERNRGKVSTFFPS